MKRKKQKVEPDLVTAKLHPEVIEGLKSIKDIFHVATYSAAVVCLIAHYNKHRRDLMNKDLNKAYEPEVKAFERYKEYARTK